MCWLLSRIKKKKNKENVSDLGFPGGSIVGCHPWNCKELDMTEYTCIMHKFGSLIMFHNVWTNLQNAVDQVIRSLRLWWACGLFPTDYSIIYFQVVVPEGTVREWIPGLPYLAASWTSSLVRWLLSEAMCLGLHLENPRHLWGFPWWEAPGRKAIFRCVKLIPKLGLRYGYSQAMTLERICFYI